MHRLEAALIALRQALEVFTHDRQPQMWAGTQGLLGGVLWAHGSERGGADGRRLLTEAEEALRRTLEVYTREQQPFQWAMEHGALER